MAKNASGIQIENGVVGQQAHKPMQLRTESKFNDRTAVVSHQWSVASGAPIASRNWKLENRKSVLSNLQSAIANPPVPIT